MNLVTMIHVDVGSVVDEKHEENRGNSGAPAVAPPAHRPPTGYQLQRRSSLHWTPTLARGLAALLVSMLLPMPTVFGHPIEIYERPQSRILADNWKADTDDLDREGDQ